MRLHPATLRPLARSTTLARIQFAGLSLERNNLADISEENCPVISIGNSVSHKADTFSSLVGKNQVSTRTDLRRAVTVTTS